MSLKIQDNFLNEKNFLELKKTIFSTTFPWYYNDSKSFNKDNNFQFVHNLYWEKEILSPFWNVLAAPILNNLKAKKLIRVKANLTTRKTENLISEMHIDTQIKESKTAVYYCNTNNGFTKFNSGEIVKSVENRLVYFDSNIFHAGADCTDENIRIVINFNFIV